MKIFDQCLLRLKQTAHLTSDQAVAELLGMTKAALSDRKRRDSFPFDRVRALAQQRPDLHIDVDYVFSGEHAVAAKPAWLRLKAQLGYDQDEAVAEWLEMDLVAVNAYTSQGKFPVDQFRRASEQDPGAVDESYVLKGVPTVATEVMAGVRQGAPFMQVGPQEQALLVHWNSCSEADQQMMYRLLKRLSTAVAPLSEAGHHTVSEPDSQGAHEAQAQKRTSVKARGRVT